MLKESAPRQGFFERSDYNALLAVLPEYLKVPFSVAFFVGLRLEEVLGLRWEQVDFLANTIELRAGETKNGEGRVAPICAEMRTVLNEQRARRQADCPNVCFKLDRKGRAVQIKSFRKA
jgi:integrase